MLIEQKTTDNKFYLIGLMLLGMSLPLSKYTTGAFQFFLLLVLIFDSWPYKRGIKFSIKHIRLAANQLSSNLGKKLNAVWQNKTALVLISLYFLFLTSFLRGGDTGYLLTDLRIKLPLIALPFIIAAMKPLNDHKLNLILWSFTGAVFIGTLFSAIQLFAEKFTDVRELSLFISPIRFALQICFSIAILFDVLLRHKIKTAYKILLWMTIAWFIFILIKLESMIGSLILLVLIFVMLFRLIRSLRSITLKLSTIGMTMIALISLVFFVNNEIKYFYQTDKSQISGLKQSTALGNQYVHDTLSVIEDGRFIALYLCEEELRDAWQDRSNYAYDGLDLKGQPIKSTLVRFLTSKDLPKDYEGVGKLTAKEITFIEEGIANANYVYNPGLRSRISKILFGYEIYKKTLDPNGNSLTQRIEYWKASFGIVKHNFWLGAGTGHVPAIFKDQYQRMNSKLLEKNQMESHNQYLMIFISFGVFGFIWFLFVLLFPGLKTKIIYDFRYLAFLIIIAISMLTEDTLETQTGLTFFAFFNSLFLLNKHAQHNN